MSKGDSVHAVRRRRHHPRPMLVARLLCSDPACAEPFEARARTLAELATLACDCGCGLEVLALSLGPDDDPGPGPGGGAVVLLAA
jgi:hypothetical protein